MELLMLLLFVSLRRQESSCRANKVPNASRPRRKYRAPDC